MTYLIGLIGGFVCGFFGGGGGILIHPMLTHFFHLDEYKARGTSLITVFPAVIAASIVYANYQYFEWDLAWKVAIGGMIGGVMGAKVLKKIPSFYLAISFDIFLIVVSIKMIIQG